MIAHDTCFDADRLDLWRVGITPDPVKMATEKGKELAQTTQRAATARARTMKPPAQHL